MTSPGMNRNDLLRLGGLVVALVVVVAVVLLAGGGSGGAERSDGQIRGVLTSVSDTELVLQPDPVGSEPERFKVRPEDRQRLDLFHLEQHAADRLPSILFYEQVDDVRYATRVDDA